MQQAGHDPGQLRLATRCGGDERGQSMIEFAITIPVIIVTLIAVVGFAWIFYNYVTLNSAVREATYFVITDPNVTDEKVVARLREAARPLNPAQIGPIIIGFRKEGAEGCRPPNAGEKREGGKPICIEAVYTINLPTITLPYIITEGSVTLFPPLELRAWSAMRLD